MRNSIKYITGIAIVIILIFNTLMINTLIEQNEQLKSQNISILVEMKRLQSMAGPTYNNGVSGSVNGGKETAAKEVMSPLELADYLGVDMNKVYSMVENKESKIPYINIDGEYKFNRSAIEEWMKTNEQVITKR